MIFLIEKKHKWLNGMKAFLALYCDAQLLYLILYTLVALKALKSRDHLVHLVILFLVFKH